jgi:uncharacterized protein (TIGR01619 family)
MSDDWDFFFCSIEDSPASILVDLGIHEELPIEGASELVRLRLVMRDPREDGLSSKAEFDRLNDVEDGLNAALDESPHVIHYVGRVTCFGVRDFFYYTGEATVAESCLSTAMAAFPDYEFEIDSQTDADWETYRELLYPSEREFQMIMNGRVLANLEESGDKHEIEREVSHWIYFSDEADRAKFLRQATSQGYKHVESSDDKNTERPYGVSVSRVHAVDYGTLNDAVLELFDLAQDCNGDYDGWETSVEDGSTSESGD